MSFAEEKKKRVVKLLNYIVENKKVQKDAIIGTFCFEWGLRHEKIEHYLYELESAGLIEIKKDEDQIGVYNVLPTNKGIEKVKELAGSG